MKKLSLIVLFLLVSWNSAFALVGGTSVDIYVYKDYNGDDIKQFWEPYVKLSESMVLSVEYRDFVNGNCSRENAEHFLTTIDSDPLITQFLTTRRCYWFAVVDSDYKLGETTDLFWLKLSDNSEIVRLEFPAAYHYNWLPSILR